MVFRMVRRSGLLYRIVSSLAAVCFDCLLEVVWLATNTARLGFGTMVRNHDSLAATGAERTSVAPRKRASSHFEACQQYDGARSGARGMAARVARRLLSKIGRRECQVLCYTYSLARRIKEACGLRSPQVRRFHRPSLRDGLTVRWGMPPPVRAGGFPVTNIRNTTSPHWRAWLKRENRCLVPANSFAEYAPEPNPETKKEGCRVVRTERRPAAVRLQSDLDRIQRRPRLKTDPRPSPRVRRPDNRTERDSRANPPEGHAGDPDDAGGIRRVDARVMG